MLQFHVLLHLKKPCFFVLKFFDREIAVSTHYFLIKRSVFLFQTIYSRNLCYSTLLGLLKLISYTTGFTRGYFCLSPLSLEVAN